MAILPVYTTSKLHAARINLRQTPSSTSGVLFNYVKGHGFWPEVGVVCKIFHLCASTPNLMNSPSRNPRSATVQQSYCCLPVVVAVNLVCNFVRNMVNVVCKMRVGRVWEPTVHACSITN